MSLYPSLEDMKVDQMAQVQVCVICFVEFLGNCKYDMANVIMHVPSIFHVGFASRIIGNFMIYLW